MYIYRYYISYILIYNISHRFYRYYILDILDIILFIYRYEEDIRPKTIIDALLVFRKS